MAASPGRVFRRVLQSRAAHPRAGNGHIRAMVLLALASAAMVATLIVAILHLARHSCWACG